SACCTAPTSYACTPWRRCCPWCVSPTTFGSIIAPRWNDGGRASRSTRVLMTWLSDFLRRPSISGWDLIDIAIVAVLIYEMLLLIRGTRAVQMALGASFLIGL